MEANIAIAPITAAEVAEEIAVGYYHEIIEGMTLRMARIADMEAAVVGEDDMRVRILREEAFGIIGDLGEERITPEEGFDRAADMLVVAENCDCTNEYIAAICGNPDAPLGAFSQD